MRTTLPGAAPEDVESEVSEVIEEAVNTVEGVTELRSVSATGSSSVVMATFDLERDVDSAAQDVRVARAGGARALARGHAARQSSPSSTTTPRR